jgi:hypothetical protein
MLKLRTFMGAALACLAIAPAAQAADFTVTSTADGPVGTCTGFDCPSIRAALAAVAAGDTITLPAGTYDVTTPLPVTTAVTISGDTARTTSITTTSPSRVLDITADATLSHLTIRGGTAANDLGGNIRLQSATASLDRVRITGGTAGAGGGIANRNGTLIVTNSTVDGNVATPGADTDGAGGGIVNYGELAGSAALTLRNTTVSGNRATLGGGVASVGGAANALTLDNATVALNRGDATGPAGVYAQSGQFTAGSSIIADNLLLSDDSKANCGGSRATSQGWNVEDSDQCLLRQDPDRVNVPDAGMPAGLTDDGETPVLIPEVASPAVNVQAEDCLPLDQRGVQRPRGPACDAGAVELDYALRIDSAPPASSPNTEATFTFSSTADDVDFECALNANAYNPCFSPNTISDMRPGAYVFHVRARSGTIVLGETERAFAIEPGRPVITAPVEDAVLGSAFTLAGTAAGSEFVQVYDNDVVVSTVGVDAGEWELPLAGLADGTHVFTATASVAGASSGRSAPRTVRVETVVPTPTATPTASPEGVPATVATATPTPAPVAVATPSPTPQADETVVVRPSEGTILVRKPGTTDFVPISRSSGIPLGSEVDARKGKVVLTSEPGEGKPLQRATFYGGLFLVQQAGAFIELTLSEELAPCKKRKAAASAAAAKPKSRKLWGDGKGKFRTKGQYSAATVRGTKWLVEDSCEGTLTRVSQGIVSVRDNVKKKTYLVRAGKKYLAKPKR